MSMSTEKALNYFRERRNGDVVENPDENKNVEQTEDKPKSEESSTTTPETPKEVAKEENKGGDEVTKDKTETPKADVKVETDVKDSDGEKKDTSKPKPSKQEQINYAFAKEKAKIKRLQARIKALEEEAKNQKAVDKSEDGYVDYAVAKGIRDAELARAKQEVAESRDIEYAELNEQRMNDCFPDAAEKQKYLDLVKTRGKDFLAELDAADPEGVVLGYLDDSDLAPLLIRVMMTSDQYKNDVLSKTSPWSRAIALERLAQGIRYAKDKLNEKSTSAPAPESVSEPVPAKAPIPIVGKVTSSDDNSNKQTIPNWQDRLRKLNAARGRTA